MLRHKMSKTPEHKNAIRDITISLRLLNVDVNIISIKPPGMMNNNSHRSTKKIDLRIFTTMELSL